MKLVRATDDKGQVVQCVQCSVFLKLDQAYADLDGTPFVDYYCPPCKQEKVREWLEYTAELLHGG